MDKLTATPVIKKWGFFDTASGTQDHSIARAAIAQLLCNPDDTTVEIDGRCRLDGFSYGNPHYIDGEHIITDPISTIEKVARSQIDEFRDGRQIRVTTEGGDQFLINGKEVSIGHILHQDFVGFVFC